MPHHRAAKHALRALLPLLFPICLQAQSAAAGAVRPHLGPEDAVRGHLVRAAERQWFNGSVTAVHGLAPAIHASVGVADFSSGRVVTDTTPFRLASVSKQFTAAAILLLEDAGRLSTGDRLSRFLPDYPGAERITLHQLLTHSAGVVEISRLPDVDALAATPRPLSEWVARLAREPLQFEPGSQASYSNSGYLLLSAVIERVTGSPFGDFMRQRVFEPLGMARSGVLTPRTVVAGEAVGYRLDDAGRPQAPERLDITALAGAGALHSTPADMGRWGEALVRRALLSDSAWRKMFTASLGGFGYGWRLERRGARESWGHGGSVPGFAARVDWSPGDSLFVAVLKNIENLPRVFDASEMTVAVLLGGSWRFPEPSKAVALSPAELARLAGRYELSPTLTLAVTTDGRVLSVQAGSQPAIPFAAIDALQFRSDRLNATVRFVEESGRIVGLVLSQGGRELPGRRLLDDLAHDDLAIGIEPPLDHQ